MQEYCITVPFMHHPVGNVTLLSSGLYIWKQMLSLDKMPSLSIAGIFNFIC